MESLGGCAEDHFHFETAGCMLEPVSFLRTPRHGSCLRAHSRGGLARLSPGERVSGAGGGKGGMCGGSVILQAGS